METTYLSFIAVDIFRHIPFHPPGTTKPVSNKFWVTEKQLLSDILDLRTRAILRLQVTSGEKTNLVKIGRVPSDCDDKVATTHNQPGTG